MPGRRESIRTHVMHHGLTAVFNNPADAQHVLDELLSSGFPRSRTLLASPPGLADTSGATNNAAAKPRKPCG